MYQKIILCSFLLATLCCLSGCKFSKNNHSVDLVKISETTVSVDFGGWHGESEIEKSEMSRYLENDSLFLYNRLFNKRQFKFEEEIKFKDSISYGKWDILTCSSKKFPRIKSISYFSVRHYADFIERFHGKVPDSMHTLLYINNIPYDLTLMIDDEIEVGHKIDYFKIYTFYANKFILLKIGNTFAFTAGIKYHILLFKLENNNKITPIELPIKLDRPTSLVFEDFNNDGILDYAPLNENKAIVEFYSLNSQNKFMLNPKYKVAFSNFVDLKIDYEKTRWFGPNAGLFELKF
jgi:hypothetical protein